jgi:hypothetical protein
VRAALRAKWEAKNEEMKRLADAIMGRGVSDTQPSAANGGDPWADE